MSAEGQGQSILWFSAAPLWQWWLVHNKMLLNCSDCYKLHGKILTFIDHVLARTFKVDNSSWSLTHTRTPPCRRIWQPTNILAWEIPWTEEPGGLQSMGVKKSDKTKRMNTTTYTHHTIHFNKTHVYLCKIWDKLLCLSWPLNKSHEKILPKLLFELFQLALQGEYCEVHRKIKIPAEKKFMPKRQSDFGEKISREMSHSTWEIRAWMEWGDLDFSVPPLEIPRLGRSPRGEHGDSSIAEKPLDRGVWWATVPRIAQSRTRLKPLSRHAWCRKKKTALDHGATGTRWCGHVCALEEEPKHLKAPSPHPQGLGAARLWACGAQSLFHLSVNEEVGMECQLQISTRHVYVVSCSVVSDSLWPRGL